MRVLGIMSSERMLLSETAIDLEHWRERFERCAAQSAQVVQVLTPQTSPLEGCTWQCGSSRRQRCMIGEFQCIVKYVRALSEWKHGSCHLAQCQGKH